MILLTDEEIAREKDCEMYGDIKLGDLDCEGCSGNCRFIAKAQLKEVVELLEDALENSFVMAYLGEGEPYESTIDPITIREIISDMRQALLKEVKEYV